MLLSRPSEHVLEASEMEVEVHNLDKQTEAGRLLGVLEFMGVGDRSAFSWGSYGLDSEMADAEPKLSEEDKRRALYEKDIDLEDILSAEHLQIAKTSEGKRRWSCSPTPMKALSAHVAAATVICIFQPMAAHRAQLDTHQTPRAILLLNDCFYNTHQLPILRRKL
ncbi:uncharacterized protein BDZ99DRAFT_520458 [Mytilinidion resinicola]|uniref:Uncharacterized protein n=1 Tax=Mytilinidion resinicola TaxID=574789 RepID=A0A6A6YR78_9PEZI|nr:uncharacterized protein BDZ99DRAFT_520458 [Mytilinidion resinicola]KAF2810387.1 hypothetical protein BDZ99DRAFT_520458 [Mytilinidion resinicola]